jgi:hypothetical protein
MSEKPTGAPENGAPEVEVNDSWTGRLERSLAGDRSKVQGALSDEESVRKSAEFLDLEKGYDDALDTLRTFQLLRNNEIFPDFDQILRTFTPEMLVAAKDFKSPTLVLSAKGRSIDDLVAAMDGHKTMLFQRKVYTDQLFRHMSRKPENCGAHIVEGAAEMGMHEFDIIYSILKTRVELFAEHKRAIGVGGMDLMKYLPLMMQSLKNRQPIDAKTLTATILDEELPGLSETHIPYACWNPVPWKRGVDIDWTNPDKRETSFRFRRSVGGDVPSV